MNKQQRGLAVLSRAEDIASRSYGGPVASRAHQKFAHCRIFTRLADAEPDWRTLEASGALTPYQRFDFLDLWQRHIGAAEGVEPLIVAAYDELGEPLCVLPLGKYNRGPFQVARFLGGKHANYSFGLWRKGTAFDRDFVQGILDQIAAERPEVAALELRNQPVAWHGSENPFMQFPHQPSPSPGYRLKLGDNGEAVLARQLSASYRGRIRNRERKLAKLEGYRYFVASILTK